MIDVHKLEEDLLALEEELNRQITHLSDLPAQPAGGAPLDLGRIKAVIDRVRPLLWICMRRAPVIPVVNDDAPQGAHTHGELESIMSVAGLEPRPPRSARRPSARGRNRAYAGED